MKRILIFIDWFYPAYKAGGPVQSVLNLVNNLSGQYSIFVFTSDRDLGDRQSFPDIEVDCWNSWGNGVSVYYYSKQRLGIRTIHELLINIKPDTIYLNSMFSVRFALLPLLYCYLAKWSGKIVLAPRGMLHAGAMKYNTFKKRMVLKMFYFARVYRWLTFQATDEQESQDIKYYFPSSTVWLVGNFANTDIPSTKAIAKPAGEARLIFLSRISPKKGLLELLMAMENISAGYVIYLDIYGEIEDPAYWRLCEAQIGKAGSSTFISYKGPVPHEKVLSVLQASHFFVLPSAGENFGHAIYESFSASRPVIISNKTPWRNLESKSAGWDLPLSDWTVLTATLEKAASLPEDKWNTMCAGAKNIAFIYANDVSRLEKYKKMFD